ncbi:MAG: hypothetical protein GX321_08910, partial [Clostridiales bacterium]|nr:hypothetical protein [Clostridiales bacterium]
MVLWGLPILTVLVFFVITILDNANKKNVASGIGNQKKNKSRRFRPGKTIKTYMETMLESDLFVVTIGLCAIGLVLIPEVVYVEDIYSGDYKRANTMFKLTYQAFIMFGICFGYIFIRLLRYGRGKWQRIVATISLCVFSLTLPYSVTAVKSWYGDITNKERYEGLDATAFVQKDFKDDYLAIKWLNDNVSGTPVVLEANGYSYTDYQRVSVITGLPTVLGWYTHENLWKSETNKTNDMVLSELNRRSRDIEEIYTSEDEKLVRMLIKRYDVSYIYVGALEEEKYEMVNHDLLRGLGEVVFENHDTEEFGYKTYIIKINI